MPEAVNYRPDPIPRPRRDYPSLNLGGGSGVEQVYEGRAPAIPDDPTKPAVDFPLGGGTMLQWSVQDQTWV